VSANVWKRVDPELQRGVHRYLLEERDRVREMTAWCRTEEDREKWAARWGAYEAAARALGWEG